MRRIGKIELSQIIAECLRQRGRERLNGELHCATPFRVTVVFVYSITL